MILEKCLDKNKMIDCPICKVTAESIFYCEHCEETHCKNCAGFDCWD